MKKINQDTLLLCLALSIAGLLIGVGIAYSNVRTKDIRYLNDCDTTRNIAYEHYCDSIWEHNQDYYLDVLVTTDEYQDYIEQNGRWWNE